MEISITEFTCWIITAFCIGGIVFSLIGRVINTTLKRYAASLELKVDSLIKKTQRMNRVIETTSAEKIKD